MTAPARLLSAVLLCALAAAAQPASPVTGLEQEIDRAVRTFDSPGLAVAVVKDGAVVYSKGFGVRKLGAAAPVDSRTLFGIGSCTKAFTAAALAILSDERKLSWDDHVVDRLPGFQLYDPYVTRELRIRDLLTHRSGLGLGAGDLMFFPPTDLSEDDIVSRVKFIKPADGLRYRWAYNNLMYLVAGKVIEAVSGKKWGEFIRERIFVPAGMTASSTSINELRASPQAATPHAKVDGKHVVIDYSSIDNCASAGAINSNLEDLAKWVSVQLADGALPGGKRLFSAAAAREMHAAQFTWPVSDPPPALAALRTNFAAYGLGWFLSEHRGYKVVRHDGGVSGFLSLVMLIPDAKLGIIVLENGMSNVMQPVSLMLADRYLSVQPPVDWAGTMSELFNKREAAMRKQIATERNRESKPSLPLESYAGKYSDPWRGEIAIAHEGGKLIMRFSHTGGLVGELEHWQHDTFIARWRDRSLDADAYVTFSLNPDGSIHEIRMKPVSPTTDFSFDFQDLTITPVGRR